MSKLTLSELVAEMQGKSLTYGWDAVTLYDQRKANELLLQLYLERFNTRDGYIEPMSMIANWGDGTYKEHIYNLKLSAPWLSFEKSDAAEPARARLTMDMLGGMIVSTRENSGGVTYVSRILRIVPVGGPQLWMEQPVTKGLVKGVGEVVIDLKDADKFNANFVIGVITQEEVGQRFKAYFEEKLTDEQKFFSLGNLGSDENGILTPKSFEIRTMASAPLALKGDQQYGDGAVMMFITLKDGTDSEVFPNANSTYLIPADDAGTQYTGAMFLSSRLLFDKIIRPQATEDIGHGLAFLDYTPGNGGGIDIGWSLKGGSGGVSYDFLYEFRHRDDDFPGKFTTRMAPGFAKDAFGEALTIAGRGSRIELSWNKHFEKNDFNVFIDYQWPAEDTDFDGVFEFKLDYFVAFDVVLDVGTGVVSFVRDDNSERYSLEATKWSDMPDLAYIQDEVIVEFHKLYRPVLESILENVLAPPALDTFLIRNLLFPGHNALQPTKAFVPGDLALFGQIDPRRTSFVLQPSSSTIESGSTLQFTPSRMPDNPRWSVTDVDGVIAAPGCIEPSGLYTAPPQSALPEGYVVVRVMLEGTIGGNLVQSTALVSVVYSATVTDPMFDSCDIGKTLELSAAAVGGETETLRWSIATSQWGSTLVEISGEPNKRLYTAGGLADKTVPFPIDIIEVKNPTSGAIAYIYISIKKEGLLILPMTLHESSDPEGGWVRFQLVGEEGPLDPSPSITGELLMGEGTLVYSSVCGETSW